MNMHLLDSVSYIEARTVTSFRVPRRYNSQVTKDITPQHATALFGGSSCVIHLDWALWNANCCDKQQNYPLQTSAIAFNFWAPIDPL